MGATDLERLFRLDVLVTQDKASQLELDEYECLLEYWLFHNQRTLAGQASDEWNDED